MGVPVVLVAAFRVPVRRGLGVVGRHHNGSLCAEDCGVLLDHEVQVALEIESAREEDQTAFERGRRKLRWLR